MAETGKTMLRSGPLAATLIAFAALVAGCSTARESTTAPPTADDILLSAADTMGAVDTVKFSIVRSGAPVYIDNSETVEFVDADGRFASPGSADAVATVKPLGFTTKIGAVAIDGDIWMSDPVTGRWGPAPTSFTFDPAILFDPDLGFRPLLADGLSDVRFLGETKRDDVDTYHISGIADAERVEVITAGMVADQNVAVEMWINTSTSELVAVNFDAQATNGTSTWDLSFREYGAEVDIKPPSDT